MQHRELNLVQIESSWSGIWDVAIGQKTIGTVHSAPKLVMPNSEGCGCSIL